MIRITWEWLGQGLALDLADTVVVIDGEDHDLIDSRAGFEDWARAEAGSVDGISVHALIKARWELLELRSAVRDAVAAVTAGTTPSSESIQVLNRASAQAPAWVEVDTDGARLRDVTSAGANERLIARYARSAMQLIVDEADDLRRCPAPSCGMFYVSSRKDQTWCSTQCGTRARVARHYRKRHHAVAS